MKLDRTIKLAQTIDEIDQLDRAGCLDLWRRTFERSPPKHLSRPFMKRVLIWRVQTQVLGGAPKATERRLKQIASGKSVQTPVKPGSQLVREWNGRTYRVEVVEGGYMMDGKPWRSLSAIARHITGARWSGPRFFGVG
ncbi:MAG: DUF2924 domain-containing protein [Pseudomonadota bacterium]